MTMAELYSRLEVIFQDTGGLHRDSSCRRSPLHVDTFYDQYGEASNGVYWAYFVDMDSIHGFGAVCGLDGEHLVENAMDCAEILKLRLVKEETTCL